MMTFNINDVNLSVLDGFLIYQTLLGCFVERRTKHFVFLCWYLLSHIVLTTVNVILGELQMIIKTVRQTIYYPIVALLLLSGHFSKVFLKLLSSLSFLFIYFSLFHGHGKNQLWPSQEALTLNCYIWVPISFEHWCRAQSTTYCWYILFKYATFTNCTILAVYHYHYHITFKCPKPCQSVS